MKKNTYYSVISMVLLTMTFFSCSPKYTASFQPSGNFYTPEKKAVVPPAETSATSAMAAAETARIEPIEAVPVMASTPLSETVSAPAEVRASSALTASTKETLITRLSEVPSIKKLVEKHRANVEEIKNSGADQKTIARQVRQERRDAQKEVKKELYKEIKSAKKAEKKNMNQKVFVGLVIFSAGVIVAILASGPIGAVGIIVGVALIAWGIIEQGGV